MNEFVSRSIRLVGAIKLKGSIEAVFRLFSPQGEKQWVPGWDPEFIHPPGADWKKGLIFRTREEKGDAVWIVTQFDPARHDVEYHRVEPELYVARIRVQCTRAAESITKASINYEFVGLSQYGNSEIAKMTQKSYDQKMKHWTSWINDYLEA